MGRSNHARDSLYVVNPATKKLTRVGAVSFSEIGIKERQDLEQWVLNNPEVLGEDLLVVSTEYERFDKSSKRLDVLALDKVGTLVVVELKLGVEHTLADQQAIRYAAFCSTMTTDGLLEALSQYQHCSLDEAESKVFSFLQAEELPTLETPPRIIIAAGSLDDQELTATVLWLRKLGLDISCIELTPYRLPESGHLILAPKKIIPLPEAKDYVVRVEQKEIATTASKKRRNANLLLWKAIAERFNSLGVEKFRANPSGGGGMYMQLRTGFRNVHYEWAMLKHKSILRVAIHFEDAEKPVNLSRLKWIQELQRDINKGTDVEFVAEPWGERWATAEFRLPYDENQPLDDVATKAAELMKILIERTWSTLRTKLSEK